MRHGAWLVPIVLCLAACGGVKPGPAPRATAPPNPAPPPPRPPSDLDEAKRAEREGRLAEAAALFEDAASTLPDGQARLEAQVRGARLRLSAEAPVRDVRKGEALLSAVLRSTPSADVALPVRDLIRLLEEASELRAQVRTLRGDVKTLEADIAKKDEALRRVTSAVVGGKPPQND